MYSTATASHETGPEAGSLGRPTNPIPIAHCSGWMPYPANALANWETIPLVTPGIASPFSQEAFEATRMFGATSACYSPYPNTSSTQGPLPITHAYARWDMGQPLLSHSLGQPTNARVDKVPPNVPEDTGYQSFQEMPYVDRSPLEPQMPSSALLTRNVPTERPGPDHAPLNSHNDDHDSFGVLPNPLEHPSSRRLTDALASLGSWTADVTPVVAYHPPLPVPISWRMVPQRPYLSRTKDKSFLKLQEFTFRVNMAPGFNMRCALDQSFVGLEGRDDLVLETANGPVSCRLLFPGYPTNTRCNQIAAKNWRKNPTPITKSKLAYEVAKRVNQYLHAVTKTPIDPSTDPRWRVGQGCMKLEKMYLVRVTWVSKGSLQPEIWVDTDDP